MIIKAGVKYVIKQDKNGVYKRIKYVIKPGKNGVYRWIKVKESVKSPKSPRITSLISHKSPRITKKTLIKKGIRQKRPKKLELQSRK
jgi:hypothetical protein